MARNRSRSPVTTGVLIALAIIAILLALWLISLLRTVIVFILISTVLVMGIDPLVQGIRSWRLPKNRRIPHGLAILIVLLGAILAMGGILFYIGSVAWIEGSNLWMQIPELFADFQTWLSGITQRYPQIPPLEDLIVQAQEQLGQIGQYALQTTAAVFGALGGLVSSLTVLVLIFYIALEKDKIKRGFLTFIPPQNRQTVSDALSEAGSKMGGWLRGQLILGVIVVVVISAAMAILGMPYPLILGLIGGIAELVPLLGPAVAAAVAVPIALASQPLWVTIAVVIFFIVFTQIEGNWLVPRIMESQVELSPLVTIVALLVGITLLGFIGALLAIPLAAGIRVLVNRLVVPAIQQPDTEIERIKE